MKIIVTGANGFIGSALIQYLSEQGHQCDGLDLQFTKDLPLHKKYQIDISEEFQLTEKYDYVFHLGAYNVTHVGDKDEEKYQRINADGTRNVIKSCQFDKFVFLSTMKVYEALDGVINEDSNLLPTSAYAQSKLDAEKICQAEIDSKKLIIFRSVNVAGFGQASKALIPVFFEKALKNEKIDIFVPRTTEVHLLAVEDLINLFAKVLENKNRQGIFNIASKDVITIEQAALMIKDICRSSSEINFSNNEMPVNPRFDAKKVMRIFEWEPKQTCREIIRQYGEHITNGK